MTDANGEKKVDHSDEVKMLEQESQLPLDELLKDYLDHRENIPLDSPSGSHSHSPSPTGDVSIYILCNFFGGICLFLVDFLWDILTLLFLLYLS